MRRILGLTLITAATLALAGCDGTPEDVVTLPPASAGPLATASTPPSVDEVDLEAWGASALPDAGTLRSGLLGPDLPFPDVTIAAGDTATTLTFACATDAGGSITVQLRVEGGTDTTFEVECAVGPVVPEVRVEQVIDSGKTASVTITSEVSAIYVVGEQES